MPIKDLPKLRNNHYDYTSTTAQNDATSNIIYYMFRYHTTLKLAFPQVNKYYPY
jgi:hypothetical protein